MTINTLYELARNSVEKFASKVAFSMFEGDDVTYAEVGRRIAKVQEILTGAGLQAGDKVALLSSNMPNWGVCYFAVTSAGMIAVPILPDFSGEELDMIIEHSEARALLVSDKLFTKLSKETIGRLNVVVRTKNLGVIAQQVHAQGSTAVPKPDDLAVIIYTSGTTSKPKGVMLTHSALCAQVGISSSIFPVQPDDVFLSVLPLSHTYECSIGMIYPFSMGAQVVYLDRPPTASALMPALRAVRPSVMLIVPLIIEKIYRLQVLAKFKSTGFWRTLYKIGFMRRYLHRVAGKKLLKLFGGRLRFLGIGGAKLDGDAEKFLLEAKVPYAIGYGLTETAPLLAGAVIGATRSLLVFTGMHLSLGAVCLQNITQYGYDYILPVNTMGTLAIVGTCLGVWVKAKKQENKSVAMSAFISSFIGITEPGIYGVLLKYKNALIADIIAGGVAGAFVAVGGGHATAYVNSCILSLPVFVGDGFVFVCIGMAIAAALGFGLVMVMGIDEGEDAPKTGKAAPAQVPAGPTVTETVSAPADGRLTALYLND